jgi:arylsulfatase A-like enzyme
VFSFQFLGPAGFHTKSLRHDLFVHAPELFANAHPIKRDASRRLRGGVPKIAGRSRISDDGNVTASSFPAPPSTGKPIAQANPVNHQRLLENIGPVSPTRPNVLFITLDQFRADTLSCAGHPLVQTPNLDALAAQGVRFARHYSQAAPCGPGRAALYTGTYQMNNRVVANGTPLDARFDNVALVAKRAGYIPTLFGYTDQSVDPRTVADQFDPRLSTYEGVLPGFEEGLLLVENQDPWLDWLRGLGYSIENAVQAWLSEGERPAEHSTTTFLTNHVDAWIRARCSAQTSGAEGPWFAHASYLRPHPPYRAAGHYAAMYNPADCPLPQPIPTDHHSSHHPVFARLLKNRAYAASARRTSVAQNRAQYYGMVSEVDDALGRLWRTLQELGAWDSTLIVVTADHGEQLGDQGLLGKAGFYESSYNVLSLIRDPALPDGHGRVVDAFTENIDILPTICERIDLSTPVQCDGVSLVPFLYGSSPVTWREAATYEWDWREDTLIAQATLEADGSESAPVGRSTAVVDTETPLEQQHLCVRRSTTHAYVQFGDGTWRCFNLALDPTWQTEETDPLVILAQAQAMLVWRSTHSDRTHTSVLLRDIPIGL